MRVQIKDEVTKSRYLAAIVHSSNDAIISCDLNGIITTWNRAAERLFGYAASEVTGKSISILAPPAGPDDQLLIQERIRQGKSIAHHETVRRRKGGTNIPVSIAVSPIVAADGQIVGACGIARDITRSRGAEDHRFRLVVEAAPNAMIMVDAHGRITLINSETTRLFGYERMELLGQSVDILVPERFRKTHEGDRDRFFRAPTARAMGAGRDLFGVRKDGTEMPIEIGLNPIGDPEGRSVLVSIIDITERKLSEDRMKRSLAEKQALLQEVHHRVKNNLCVISALLSMQANTIDDSETIAKLRDSERRVMSMAMIHEQLYQHDDMSSIDFSDYARELAAQLVATYAKEDGITWRLEGASTQLSIEQSIPCGLILNELITNALKYAYPEGSGEILIGLSVDEDRVRLSVSDQGRGLPTPFNPKKSKSLGMKIIQLLTAQLDGTLEIGSPARGASFSISFKRHASKRTAGTQLAAVGAPR
jgi:PAS domain S-box-containing protein